MSVSARSVILSVLFTLVMLSNSGSARLLISETIDSSTIYKVSKCEDMRLRIEERKDFRKNMIELLREDIKDDFNGNEVVFKPLTDPFAQKYIENIISHYPETGEMCKKLLEICEGLTVWDFSRADELAGKENLELRKYGEEIKKRAAKKSARKLL